MHRHVPHQLLPHQLTQRKGSKKKGTLKVDEAVMIDDNENHEHHDQVHNNAINHILPKVVLHSASSSRTASHFDTRIKVCLKT